MLSTSEKKKTIYNRCLKFFYFTRLKTLHACPFMGSVGEGFAIKRFEMSVGTSPFSTDSPQYAEPAMAAGTVRMLRSVSIVWNK